MRKRSGFRLLLTLFTILIPIIYLGEHGGWHKPLRVLQSELDGIHLIIVLALSLFVSFLLGYFALSKLPLGNRISYWLGLKAYSVASGIDEDELIDATVKAKDTETSKQEQLLTHPLLKTILEQSREVTTSTDDLVDQARNLSPKEFRVVFEKKARSLTKLSSSWYYKSAI